MRGRGRGAPAHAVVDHRPRALDIAGFSDLDRVDLLPHFAVSTSLTCSSSTGLRGELCSVWNKNGLTECCEKSQTERDLMYDGQ